MYRNLMTTIGNIVKVFQIDFIIFQILMVIAQTYLTQATLYTIACAV